MNIYELIQQFHPYSTWIIMTFSIWVIYIFLTNTGMYSLLKKAISMILQQLCSLILTVFFLSFKIINSIELYIVLLIDILTGKNSAINRVTVLAISALSIASFYTTFSGMQLLVNEWTAGLITIGVQTFLLIASLQIGMDINLNKNDIKENQKNSSNSKNTDESSDTFVKIITLFLIVLLFTVAILFTIQKNTLIKNILYSILIILFIIIFALSVNHIVNRKSEKKLKSKVLLILYFATLGFSSFFSYNSFMNKMYTKENRYLDAFLNTKITVINAIDNLHDSIDRTEYDNTSKNILTQLNTLQKKMNESESKYIEYTELLSQEKTLKQEIRAINNRYDQNSNNLYQNTANQFLDYSIKGIDQINKNRDEELRPLKAELNNIQTEIKNHEFNDTNKRTPYEQIRKNVNSLTSNSQITLLLQKEDWEPEDIKNFNLNMDTLRNTINNSSEIFTDIDSISIDKLSTLSTYKEFQYQYKVNYQKILATHFNENITETGYNEKTDELFNYAYTIIDSFPLYEKGSITSSSELSKTQEVINIEKAFRSSNQNTNDLEKNIKAFFDNKLLGLLCSIIALLMDCLILFVGLLTPRPISHFEKTNCDFEKKKAILENLFNKPIK